MTSIEMRKQKNLLLGAMLGIGITGLVTILSSSVEANTCESIVKANLEEEGFIPQKNRINTACKELSDTLLFPNTKGRLATRTYLADVEGYRTWHSAELYCTSKLIEAIKPEFDIIDPKTEAFVCINPLNYDSIRPESLNMERLYRLNPKKAVTEYNEWLNL